MRQPHAWLRWAHFLHPGDWFSMVQKQFLFGLAVILGAALPAAASPTMIRLGYADCAACHVSPQGAGLLTDYGKGIDLAQSIRVREYEPAPDAQTRRLRQDLRGYLGFQYARALAPVHTTSTATDAQVWHRATARLTSNQRVSSVISIDGWPGSFSSGAAKPKIIVNKAVWEYRPIDGLELAVGRDVLPSGLENTDHQRELRSVFNAGASEFPTQAKLFWWTKRVQVTPYIFGPAGDESRTADRRYGAGALAGIVTMRQHAVIGLAARAARMTAGTVHSVGAYARLGFGRWGILTEHDRIDRAVDGTRIVEGIVDVRTRGFTGLTQVFVAPREWLVTSLGVEYLPTGSTGHYTYRLLPSAQVRVSDKLTFVVGQKDRFSDAPNVRGRSFAVQLFVKTGT